MKKTIKYILACLLLCICIVGCEKENTENKISYNVVDPSQASNPVLMQAEKANDILSFYIQGSLVASFTITAEPPVPPPPGPTPCLPSDRCGGSFRLFNQMYLLSNEENTRYWQVKAISINAAFTTILTGVPDKLVKLILL